MNWYSHKHKWVTTHTNKWMIPTAQACATCPETREVTAKSEGDPDLHYRWKYSDGSLSDPIPHGDMGDG